MASASCVAWGILVKVCTILQVRATVYVGGGARPPRGRSLVEVAVRRNLLDLGELPLAVAQRADRARRQPALDAVQVEDVAARACGRARARGVSLGLARRRSAGSSAPQAMLSPGCSCSSTNPCAKAEVSPFLGVGGGRRARTCAWYSMLGSCRLLRQIAHVSVSTFHDHTATAFHFLTRNLRASLLSAD